MVGKAATIQDVARKAGVSTATVSRALTRPEKVSQATRDIVTNAVRQTGYRVNRTARNLRTKRADSTLVLLPDLSNPFFSAILEGMAQHLSANGISMLVAGTRQIAQSGEDLVDYFDDGRADALIIFDGSFDHKTLDRLRASPNCRRLIFACEWAEGAAIPSLRSDNADGARLAIRHLHGLGHRRIGHVTGPQTNVLTKARRAAARAECTALGLRPDDYWEFEGDFSLEAGIAAAHAWRRLENRPTAVFCASDMIAFGLISELSKHGHQVPGDLAIVGFDDIELAETFIPPLTTIRQDRYQLGIAAAKLLLADAPDEDPPKVLPVSLVIRESTATASGY